MGKKWDEIKENFGLSFSGLKDKITEKLDKFIDSIKEKFTEMIDGIKEKLESIKKSLSDTFSNIKTDLTSVFDGIKTKIGDSMDSMVEKMKSIQTSIEEAMKPWSSTFKEKLDELGQMLKDFSFTDWLKDKLTPKQLVIGKGQSGLYTTKEGLYHLHSGERVISAGRVAQGFSNNESGQIIVNNTYHIQGSIRSDDDIRKLASQLAEYQRNDLRRLSSGVGTF